MEEVTTLKHKRQELEAELKQLQKSSRQSKYYFKNKSKQSSSASDNIESSEESKGDTNSSVARMATPESSAPSSRSHTPVAPYSPTIHDDRDSDNIIDLMSHHSDSGGESF